MVSNNKKRGTQQECIPNEFDVLRDLVKSQNKIKNIDMLKKLLRSGKGLGFLIRKKDSCLK